MSAGRAYALDGFERHRAPGAVLFVASELVEPVSELRLLEADGLDRALACSSRARGRGTTAVVPLPGTALRLHLRPFRRGGWLAGIRSDGLLGLGRPLAEIRVAAQLAALRAPVARPVLVVGHRRGATWNAVVGTVFEEDAVDAGQWLAASLGAPTGPVRRLGAARAAGRALRWFHDCGGSHHDLHVGNLLVRERADGTDVVIVDLDRAAIVPALGARRRIHELMRLHRSLVKRGLVDAAGRRGYARFFSSYTAGDRSLRHALLAGVGREQWLLAFHEAGYRAGRRRTAR